MSSKKITVDISHRTIIFTLFLLLLILFFQHIESVLIGLFIAVLIAVAINPLVNWLEKRRISRSISAFLILVIIFALLTLLAVSLIAPLLDETQNFIKELPRLIERLGVYNIDLGTFGNQISAAPRSVLKVAATTFSGLVFFFTILVIGFYILEDRPNLKKHLITIFGETKADIYHQITMELETRLGSWVRGELMLMFVVGLMNYLGFILIGLPFAVPLAVIAGILELVPNIGPTIAAIPAAVVGFSVSPTLGFMALGLAIIVQQLENNLFVPKIMQAAIGLHPVVTIVSLMIGFNIGGPLLAVLSLPIILCLQVVVPHFHAARSSEELKIS